MDRDVINPISLCQVEIPVSDIEASLIFYSKVFGWESAPTEIHNYHILQVPDDCPFGISLIPTSKPDGALTSSTSPRRMVLYFQTEDLESICQKCREMGGTVFPEKTLPSYGTMIQITDLDHNRFGLVKKLKA